MKAVAVVVLVAVFTFGVDSQACTHEAVCLIWGDGYWEGNVQICINGTWGWVCHNFWGTYEARVVCNQLGFSTTGAVYRTSSYYGWGDLSVPIYLDYVNCFGNETKLLNCSQLNNIGVTNCGYNKVAGVVCLVQDYNE